MADHLALGFFTSSGVGKTGITVTVDVYKISDNSKVVNNQAATEVAGGLYKYLYQTATLDDYAFVFKTADTTVDAQQVAGFVPVQLPRIDAAVSSRLETTSYTAPDNAGVAAIKAKTDNLPAAPASSGDVAAVPAAVWTVSTRALTSFGTLVNDIATAVWGFVSRTINGGAVSITVTSPILPSGDIEIIAGDDYKLADGRQLEWTATTWPVLTGATVQFVSSRFTKAMTVVDAATVRLELEDTDTTGAYGSVTYKIFATLSNGNYVTLHRGTMAVR